MQIYKKDFIFQNVFKFLVFNKPFAFLATYRSFWIDYTSITFKALKKALFYLIFFLSAIIPLFVKFFNFKLTTPPITF